MNAGLHEVAQALKAGRVAEALPALKRAAAGDVERLERLVRLLIAKGAVREAMVIGREALEQGRAEDAEQLAQAMLDAGLHEPPVYYLLAASAALGGRPEVAADSARVGIAMDPAPDKARLDLAQLLLRIRQPQEAIVVLEAIPATGRDLKTRETLGTAYAMAGRRDLARAMFQGLLAEWPDHPVARKALAALAPPSLDRVLDNLAACLPGPAAVLFSRLRQGPATEAELLAALQEAGHRRILFKALVLDLSARLRVGQSSLLVATGEAYALDLGLLDAS